MKGISLLILLMACAQTVEKPSDPIAEKLESRRDFFRQCYVESDSYKGRSAPDAGEIKVSFLIDAEGKVQQERILETSFKDPNLHACVLEQLRRLSFAPARNGGVLEVKQPINFKRREE
jgi:TonB family protein